MKFYENEKKIEKAILVAIQKYGETREKVYEYLDELEMLTQTAGAETIAKIIQERDKPEVAYYVGKGKAEEIAQLAEMNEVSLIIFDEDLSPSQIRNLEKLMERKILDRSGLILDIFANHARTSEAKTQVELAQLQYTLSRLTRAWTHLSKQFGGIGTKGPGETQIETDRRIIRDKISKLKEKLVKIDSQQQTKSAARQNLSKISLVGYTNAGKSTLLNLLTNADVLAENKLFATLDSTTRVLQLTKEKKVLLSDTVGFIRKLPHNLIASFRSTLNVVREADLILHVVDLSNSSFTDHIEVVHKTIKEIGAEKTTELIIFNKVDKVLQEEVLEFAKRHYAKSIFISASRGINISSLLEKINVALEENIKTKQVEISINNYKLISEIHNVAEVVSTEYDEEKVILELKIENTELERLEKQYGIKFI